ncbi:hypothetical protein Y032_0049g1859 [Ancylostoma ceylanicum]|uniref:Reverse transcriptase domain-containing protein n=1 Tax=Ancylostoma ceylanicum TaxID=53326 RepID=A0A016UBD2_9BILA|nr:hypothetical protein Y032_0049g1859 [Ancylostoma ceylanicum]
MIFHELYSNFTTRISSFFNDITIDANMGVRVDGRLLHHLRFAGDIVLITININQPERMLADFDDAC